MLKYCFRCLPCVSHCAKSWEGTEHSGQDKMALSKLKLTLWYFEVSAYFDCICIHIHAFKCNYIFDVATIKWKNYSLPMKPHQYEWWGSLSSCKFFVDSLEATKNVYAAITPLCIQCLLLTFTGIQGHHFIQVSYVFSHLTLIWDF